MLVVKELSVKFETTVLFANVPNSIREIPTAGVLLNVQLTRTAAATKLALNSGVLIHVKVPAAMRLTVKWKIISPSVLALKDILVIPSKLAAVSLLLICVTPILVDPKLIVPQALIEMETIDLCVLAQLVSLVTQW